MVTYRRKGPDFKAAGPTERLLRACGVPSFYWRFSRQNIGNPSMIDLPREYAKEGKALTVSTEHQESLIDRLFKEDMMATSSMILGIGSYPTDERALIMTCQLVRRAFELKLRPLMINTHQFPSESDLEQIPDVVILWNMYHDCPPNRVEICRHWLSKFDDIFIIAVVAGCDPLFFFHRKLNYRIDATLYFKGDGSSVPNR